MNPRDAYLAWQADIGTEEVILAQPWVRPAPASRPGPAHASTSFSPGYREERDGGEERGFEPSNFRDVAASNASAPAPATPKVSENFFQTIAATLAKPEPYVSRTRAPRAPEPFVPPAGPVSEIPELGDLEAYWAFLEEAYPKWYPGVAARPVRALGSPRPRLAVAEFSPSGRDDSGAAGGRVFAGESGALLDRMLKAIGLEPGDLYLTSLMKTPPPGKSWSRRDAARMLPAFMRELRLARCGLVLLLGETCAQIVMRTGQGLATLEGQAVNAEDLAFTATWHPEDLLQNEALKRQAWNHLKWVQTRLPARGN